MKKTAAILPAGGSLAAHARDSIAIYGIADAAASSGSGGLRGFPVSLHPFGTGCASSQ